MWNEIQTKDDITALMELVAYFHDSCIKEIHYVSGAFVNEDRSMYPVSSQRILRMIVPRQFQDLPVIELEFSGLEQLQLTPSDKYTCEIMDASLLKVDDGYIWCDCGGLSEAEIASYPGTVIHASALRWREVPYGLGAEEVFHPAASVS